MTSELSVTYRLRRHPSEISRARELARKALTDWGLADHTDLAELIVSELATNALRHGAGPITVRLAYTQDGDLWLEVHDHGPGRPVTPEDHGRRRTRPRPGSPGRSDGPTQRHSRNS